MKIFRAAQIPSERGDPETFTGDVERRTLASDKAGTPVNVYRVAFEPGARTHWHTHDGPQWLLVVEGRIRIQKLGEPPQEVGRGRRDRHSAGRKTLARRGPVLAGRPSGRERQRRHQLDGAGDGRAVSG